MNKIIIVGRLGADPKFHTFPDGGQNSQFSVATTEYWKDRSTGENCEETEWHRCIANGGIASRAERLKKGSLVAIEGRNRTRVYTDKSGVERTVTQIQINKLEILDGTKKATNEEDSSQTPAQSRNASTSTNRTDQARPQAPAMANLDDDTSIPF